MAVDTPALRKRVTIAGLVLILAYIGGIQLLGLVRDRGWVTAGTVQALKSQGVFYLKDQRVFVVDDRGRPLALSAISPHLGEQLLYCRSSGWFEDVNGDHFDGLGYYALGPAPRGMDRVEVRRGGDLVQIKPDAVTPGPPRGAREPEPPTGPFCGTTNLTSMPGQPGFAATPAP